MAEKIELFTPDGKRKYLIQTERDAYIAAASGYAPNNKLTRPTDRTLALTPALTGCRISEALNLTIHNIDLEGGQITFRTLKQGTKTKIRAVPVPPEFLARLDSTHNIQARKALKKLPDARLWPMSRTTAWRIIKQIMASINVNGAQACPKGLRHAFAVHAIMVGIPLTVLQKWMGHASIETTAIYLDIIGGEQQQLAAKMWANNH